MYKLDVETFQNAVLVDIAALSEVFDDYEEHLTPFQLQDAELRLSGSTSPMST